MSDHCDICDTPLTLRIVEKKTCISCMREFEATGSYSKPNGLGTFLLSLFGISLLVLLAACL